MSRSSRLLLCAVALGVLAPAPALANGRFPQSIDVVFKPGDADTYAIQATYGLLITNDAGQTWQWVCEEAVGFMGVADPDYAFTSTGLLLAPTTTLGLRLTRNLCDWTETTELGIQTVSQIEVTADGTIIAAVSVDGNGDIWSSTDDGVSFQLRSSPAEPGDWMESLRAAPSDADVLYLTGFRIVGSDKQRFLFRTDDAGMTWDPRPIDDFVFGGEDADLQIAAISPTDPDVVYARIYKFNGVGIGDHVYRSTDGGANWTKVLESGDDVTAVVVRASGEVIATTRLSGWHIAPNVAADFGPAQTSLATHCLRERAGTLYMCSNGAIPEEMTLGTSTTTTGFVSLLSNRTIAGPVDCGVGTVQHETCELQRWCGLYCQIFIEGDPVCDESCPDVVVDAGPMPGDGGIIVDPPKDDCCNVGGGPAGASVLTIVVGLGLAMGSGRRRRPR